MKYLVDSVILIDHFNGFDQATRWIADRSLVTRNTNDFPPARFDFVEVPYRI